MGVALAILWYAFALLLSLTAILLIALSLFLQWLTYYSLKVQLGLPWLKWITMKDVVALGYLDFWSRPVLYGLHLSGQLEVRLGGDEVPDETEQKVIDIIGFRSSTAHFYEFRLTSRGGRKKSKFKELLESWRKVPGLKPAPA